MLGSAFSGPWPLLPEPTRIDLQKEIFKLQDLIRGNHSLKDVEALEYVGDAL